MQICTKCQSKSDRYFFFDDAGPFCRDCARERAAAIGFNVDASVNELTARPAAKCVRCERMSEDVRRFTDPKGDYPNGGMGGDLCRMCTKFLLLFEMLRQYPSEQRRIAVADCERLAHAMAYDS